MKINTQGIAAPDSSFKPTPTARLNPNVWPQENFVSRRACMLVFMVGVLTTYLGIANSGLLPWRISVATTILALVTFMPGAWLTERLFRNYIHAPPGT